MQEERRDGRRLPHYPEYLKRAIIDDQTGEVSIDGNATYCVVATKLYPPMYV